MSNIKSEIDKWYENYIDELFAYGIAFGVEKDFVLDAIHDLFLHLFESAEILGSPKSYLFSALKNKIITSLRKQANWLSLDEEVEYDFKIEVDAEALMEDEEERRNYEKEVENLLNLLTNKQREVIYLRFIKALSIQEISEILNITPKSVRKMIYRAIERMQQGKIELLFLLMFLR
jgi:RNA polymerase sigma factor (sigma-70 family)